MAKTIKTKYGTVINVDGLDAAQVKQVLSMAQDRGAYGSKGAALAKQLQAKNKTRVAPVAAPAPVSGTPASAAPVADPQMDGKVAPINDQAGVTKTGMELGGTSSQAFLDSLGAIGKDSTAARDATYSYITRNFERDKGREMEAAKQELAERGIPIDPTNESLWSKTLGGINDVYKNQYADANTQALTVGNQFYNDSVSRAATLGGVSGSFLDSLTSADMAKLGLDQEKMLALKKLEQEKTLTREALAVEKAKVNKMGSGGGGGAPADNSDIFIT